MDMMKFLRFNLLVIIVILLVGCELERDAIYKRPEWLAGKLYSQIQDRPELSTFAECIRLTGYDSIINVSGSYTVFAPDNNAFTAYFAAHPEYNSVSDIPAETMERIVKFHIVQNPWSIDQLQQLDVFGWIDSLDLNNDEPRGFKRETLLRESNPKFGVLKSNDPQKPDEARKYIIVDTTESNWYRRQVVDSRKYAPIFYQEYFDIYNLESEDFENYFDRPFESSNVFFAGAKIIEEDIFAENGFVHIIDRVVDPMRNAYQILHESAGTNSYTDFLDLVNTFPVFSYNRSMTLEQPGADQGVNVDSLFDITYPQLSFSIVNEKTKAPSGTSGLPADVTIRYHHGLVAPTNTALTQFENEYLVGSNRWGSILSSPVHIRRMITNSYMANGPIYLSNLNRGYYNGESDWIKIDQSTIVHNEFGSNCTFIGVNKAIVPRAFSSVTGPVYLLRGYSRVMYAIEKSGLLSALKRNTADYMFFVASDNNLTADSSLFYDNTNENFEVYQVSENTALLKTVTVTDLRNLLLNQIGIVQATGIPRKEFIKTLAGNYIVVNNETGEVKGSAPTTFGYKGTEQVVVIPQQINMDTDNGTVWNIPNWFNFASGDLYGKISSSFPAFHNLLVQAGLANTSLYKYNFLSGDENYTVFVPSAAALASYNTSVLTLEELQKFLMMHFIQGDLIFTDGKRSPGYYETTRVDEKSTQYTKIFTRIYINPVIDAIEFPHIGGGTYLSVPESSVTNITAARMLSEGTETYPTIVTNGVIHQIESVLLFDQLDTE
jgi:uncharacterized surface protein with fasciclin (FAS1) repeats